MNESVDIQRGPTISKREALLARFHDLKELFTSEIVVFYFMVTVFFSMVFILPMIPMLMFVYNKNSPSINPAVFDSLKHARGNVQNQDSRQ
jgi:hypothetical protein